MSKVTVIGSGNVGATVAQYVAEKNVSDVVLIDIIEGMPQGKSLDMAEASPVHGHDRKLFGTNNYADTKDSEVVVITAGIARKPGMSRDDLLKTNASIVQTCSREALKHSPDAVFVIVTNPLDVMTYLAWQTTKLPHNRVVGMAGVLDSARFQAFIGMELNMSVQDVRAMVLGGHGDLMVPIPRYSTVNGIPIPELMSADRVESLCQRTRDGGAEIVGLLKTGSAWYAPGASAALMVEAILRDQNRLLPCCVLANGEYGLNDVYVGLPAVLGKGGVKKVVDLKLSDAESAALKKSADSIRENIDAMNKLLVPA